MGGLAPFAVFFMSVSMSVVTLLAGWCLYRILKGPAPRGPRPPSED